MPTSWLTYLLQESPSLFIAGIYGGVAILIFLIYMLINPWFNFKYEQKQRIEEKELEKEKCRDRLIVEMPSESLQVIKSITMSQSSLSIRKLSKRKRKKLDSFKIVCFCGMQLRKGTPATIYDDSKKEEFECYICDRKFDHKLHKHLLFTCPQNIIPIHEKGFVICVYCLWLIHIYNKNVKYYKHFVNSNILQIQEPTQSIQDYMDYNDYSGNGDNYYSVPVEIQPALKNRHKGQLNGRNRKQRYSKQRTGLSRKSGHIAQQSMNAYSLLRPQSTLPSVFTNNNTVRGLGGVTSNYYLFDDDDAFNDDEDDEKGSDASSDESASEDSWYIWDKDRKAKEKEQSQKNDDNDVPPFNNDGSDHSSAKPFGSRRNMGVGALSISTVASNNNDNKMKSVAFEDEESKYNNNNPLALDLNKSSHDHDKYNEYEYVYDENDPFTDHDESSSSEYERDADGENEWKDWLEENKIDPQDWPRDTFIDMKMRWLMSKHKKMKRSVQKSNYKKHKRAIEDIKGEKFTFKRWFQEIWKIKHIYIAVVLFIFDTTTDIAVATFWGQRAYREFVLGIEPEIADNVNIVGTFITCIFLLLFYRIVSCTVIYFSNFYKPYPKTKAFLQLFDAFIFWELYCSHLAGKKTENFLLISKMKAIFESVPQSILQTFIIVRSTLEVDWGDLGQTVDENIIYLSLLIACTSIIHRFNLEDSSVFEKIANKKWPPSRGYLLRCFFRGFEIVSRLLVFSLISVVIGERFAFIYGGIDFYVNLRLYRKGLIGPSWMNVVGYMISVIDLASVPSPNHLHDVVFKFLLQRKNKKKTDDEDKDQTKQQAFIRKHFKLRSIATAPGLGKQRTMERERKHTRKYYFKLIKRFIWKSSQAISVILMGILGFWIPYIICCCNRRLDHFGFVVVTSRFYQHTVLLLVMYLMLQPESLPTFLHLECGKPFCTSSDLREGIRGVSIILIIIGQITTILTFVFYLYACKYLKIGVIATERNPWLAVRVGDIDEAIKIFKEQDEKILTHEWKRNVFWKKFIAAKYSIPLTKKKYSKKKFIDVKKDPNIKALCSLLKTEDGNTWDLPLIKHIAFDAIKNKFPDIFDLFFNDELIKELNDKKPLLDPYTCIDNKGNYILHEAAKSGMTKIVYLLITKGNAKVPVLNFLGETPLHLACRQGDIEIINLLLNAWSIFKMDKNEKYPIHYGVETNNKQIVELIMGKINHLFEEHYNNDSVYKTLIGSLLLSCAQNSNQFMFNYILNEKLSDIIPNINYKLKATGLSTLHYAVLTRNINIVKTIFTHDLLKEHIDINIADNDGITPLMIAVENNDIRIVNYLLSTRFLPLERSINVNAQTKLNGYTALHFAFLNKLSPDEINENNKQEYEYDNIGNHHIGKKDKKEQKESGNDNKINKQMIIRLLSHPTIELLQDYNNEETALHLAIPESNKYKQFNSDLCQSMIKRFNQSQKDKIKVRQGLNRQSSHKRETALHLAAHRDDKKLVELLLICGADPFLRNLDKETPAEHAAKLRKKEIKETIEQYINAKGLKEIRIGNNHIMNINGMDEEYKHNVPNQKPGELSEKLKLKKEIFEEFENQRGKMRGNMRRSVINKSATDDWSWQNTGTILQSSDVANGGNIHKNGNNNYHHLDGGNKMDFDARTGSFINIASNKKLKKKCMEYYWRAVENNDFEMVRILLKEESRGIGVNVNDYIRNGRFAGKTALHIACTLGHYETLIVLMEYDTSSTAGIIHDSNIEVNVQSKIDLTTPLLLATRFNHKSCVKRLLRSDHIDVNLAALDETTPFYEACLQNNQDLIKLLLKMKTNVNITQKTRNKSPIDIITDQETLKVIADTLQERPKDKQLEEKDPIDDLSHWLEMRDMSNKMSYDELSSSTYHPYESQVCKYCNYALNDYRNNNDIASKEMFDHLWDRCISNKIKDDGINSFVFLHVFCNEGHFDLIKHLINQIYEDRTSHGTSNVNWIVKDDARKYPIQYLVEWFQYDNELRKESEWTLSYILQRTFGSLMFNQVEEYMWNNFISKPGCRCGQESMQIDWSKEIEGPRFNPNCQSPNNNINNKNKKYVLKHKPYLKFKHRKFLNNTIISMFGLKDCHWILTYYDKTNKKATNKLFTSYINNKEYKEKLKIISNSSFVFNPRSSIDTMNNSAYYHGIRKDERLYCSAYHFSHIQDIVIYLDAMREQKKNDIDNNNIDDDNNDKTVILPLFPMNAFNSLKTLILADDIPVDQLQYLLDLLRNLLSFPTSHPFISDITFIEKMFDKICVEMEEHLCRDGSEVKNEISVHIIEATAISAIVNCYKYPTKITETIIETAISQLHHTKSPMIRLMSGKLFYNIVLQLRMNLQSMLFPENMKDEYGSLDDDNNNNEMHGIPEQTQEMNYNKSYATSYGISTTAYNVPSRYNHDSNLRDDDPSNNFSIFVNGSDKRLPGIEDDEDDIYGEGVGVNEDEEKEVEFEEEAAINRVNKLSQKIAAQKRSSRRFSGAFGAVGMVASAIELGKMNKKRSQPQRVNDKSDEYSDLIIEEEQEQKQQLIRKNESEYKHEEDHWVVMQSQEKLMGFEEEQDNALKYDNGPYNDNDNNNEPDVKDLRAKGKVYEDKVCKQICDEIIERLNVENDIRVRSICYQTLGLLLICNESLDEDIKQKIEKNEDDVYINYNFWTEKDKDCCICGNLYNDIICLLPDIVVDDAPKAQPANPAVPPANIQERVKPDQNKAPRVVRPNPNPKPKADQDLHKLLPDEAEEEKLIYELDKRKSMVPEGKAGRLSLQNSKHDYDNSLDGFRKHITGQPEDDGPEQLRPMPGLHPTTTNGDDQKHLDDNQDNDPQGFRIMPKLISDGGSTNHTAKESYDIDNDGDDEKEAPLRGGVQLQETPTNTSGTTLQQSKQKYQPPSRILSEGILKDVDKDSDALRQMPSFGTATSNGVTSGASTLIAYQSGINPNLSIDSFSGNDKLIAQQSGVQYDTLIGQASDGSVRFGNKKQSSSDAPLLNTNLMAKTAGGNSITPGGPTQKILFVPPKVKQEMDNDDDDDTKDNNSEDEDGDTYALRPATGIVMLGATNENEKVPFTKSQSIDQHQIDNLHRQFSSIFNDEEDNDTNESDNEVLNVDDEMPLIETDVETAGQ